MCLDVYLLLDGLRKIFHYPGTSYLISLNPQKTDRIGQNWYQNDGTPKGLTINRSRLHCTKNEVFH